MRENPVMQDLPLMFTVSIASHHLRDADRRGVWCAPFGSTPAIPYKFYVVCVTLIPPLCVVVVPLVASKLRQLSTFGFRHRPKVYEVYDA